MGCGVFFLAFAFSVSVALAEKGVVLITGASSGIGLVVAEELAADGYKVFLAARRKEKLEKVVFEIKRAGGKAAFSVCDVEDGKSIEATFAVAEEAFGGVDFVFANAGIEGSAFGKKSFLEQTQEELQQITNVNIVGVMITLQHAVKAFRKRGGGIIVFAGSIAGFMNKGTAIATRGAFPDSDLGTGYMDYVMTKGAVDHLARYAAGLFEQENIKVFSVNMGVYKSELNDRAQEDLPDGMPISGFNPYFKDVYADPVHVATALAALFDGTSAYKSGDTFLVENDYTMHAKFYYDLLYTPGPPNVLGWASKEEIRPNMKNLKGDGPYKVKDEL